MNAPGQPAPNSRSLAHRVQKMVGRDPHEEHRAATPLELLFDLTFVVAFGVAGDQFAHLVAEGHVAAGLAGFAFAMFSIIWRGSTSPGSRRPTTPTTGSTGSPP